MSGDPEQEYFSDGISEDIITDLSKVSALWVTARNTAFTFKGKHVDVPQVARQLKVSHVLEGSVRKAGGRVRITAQLIDGATGGHVWAERYDRDLNDIFALQDEISQAIVAALKLKLLPEEKKAIEQRGTTNAEAYKLYLMARQYSVTGNAGAARTHEAIIRLCRRATEIDPDYARPWALMAGAQGALRLFLGREGDGGLAAAERALALDPGSRRGARREGAGPDARRALRRGAARNRDRAAPRPRVLRGEPRGRGLALCDAPLRRGDSVLREGGRQRGDGLLRCRHARQLLQGASAMRRARVAPRRRALARAEKVVALEPDNGSAMSFLVGALAALGEVERAKEWIERATLLDPDNLNMRYNFACTLVLDLHEFDAALDLLEPLMANVRMDAVNWTKIDPDLDLIRDHPRFKAMIAAAEARLAPSPAANPSARNGATLDD